MKTQSPPSTNRIKILLHKKWVAAGLVIVVFGLFGAHKFMDSKAATAPYHNPTYNASAADPATIRGADGRYHVYASGGTASDPFKHLVSTDLIHWSAGGRVLTSGSVPGWLASERWAPDVVKTGDHYTLTFSGGGNGRTCDAGSHKRRIGYATSSRASGPFTYRGVLVNNASDGCGYDIDPKLVNTSVGLVLYYGSGPSISAVRISMSGNGALSKNGAPKVVLKKGTDPVLIEGSWLNKHGDWYYLYYSAGNFALRDNSTNAYVTKVARSKSPLGPFEKRGTAIISGTTTFKGPGHNSTVTDKNGVDWIVYHAWYGGSRVLLTDRVGYLNGWPIINGGRGPSTISYDRPAY